MQMEVWYEKKSIRVFSRTLSPCILLPHFQTVQPNYSSADGVYFIMHLQKGRTGESSVLDAGMLPVGINNMTNAFISGDVSEIVWLLYINDV